MELMIELEYNEFYDEEVWTKVFETISHKKRINNITFFGYFLNTMQKWNADPSKTIFFKKLDDKIDAFKNKHYNADREWRYEFNGDDGLGRPRSLDEIISKKENSKIDDFLISKGGEDLTLINRAAFAEKKMKRLRMAKYSEDLFDEIVIEMMKEKRTLMEMMAELDVEDEKIMESQQRITNAKLKAGLSIAA